MPAEPADVERLLAEGKMVVIDFYATWCGPCRSYSPKFQRLEREMRRQLPEGEFAFVAVDVDIHQDLAREASVRSVPTTLAWRLGRSWLGRPKKVEVLRFSGDRPWNDLVRDVAEALGKGA